MNKSIARLLFVMIATLSLLFGVPIAGESAARAQGVTEVSIDPGESSIAVAASVEIKVNIANVVDLNTYDLTIVYDEAVVTLESWAHGGFLSNVSVVYRDEKPGWLRLAVTQLAPPGVSGNGTLLILKFKGKNTGSTTIEIQDAQLVNISNEMILPTARNGVISVGMQPTASRTNTATHTATATVLFTATDTATATRTHTFTPMLTATMNPFVTWTPTRTRTPTAITGRTITPIRAIVVTRTGTPGTAVVVQPGELMTTATPFPAGTTQAGGSPEAETAGTDQGGQPAGTIIGGSSKHPPEIEHTAKASIASPELNNGKTMDEIIQKAQKANGLLWGVGILLLASITGLTVLFINLGRRM